MSLETTLALMAIAVAIGSIALATSGVALVAMFRSVRELQKNVAEALPELRQTLETARTTLFDASREVKEVSQRTKSILDQAQAQLTHFEKTREEVTATFRAQAERVDLVLEDVLSRVQDVTRVFHSAVMRPVREVSGVMAGMKAAVQTFVLGRRPNVTQATQDEEMFI